VHRGHRRNAPMSAPVGGPGRTASAGMRTHGMVWDGVRRSRWVVASAGVRTHGWYRVSATAAPGAALTVGGPIWHRHHARGSEGDLTCAW